ncbi:MAG: VOC family protein [Ilumatobacteraceae bacterium]
MSDVDDPFERLSESGRADEAADAEFAARLRGRVQRRLDRMSGRSTLRFDLAGSDRSAPARTLTTTIDDAATSGTHQRNDTMNQVITPYLCVDDATAALDWYRDHFGAAVGTVIPWEGRIGHAELDISGAVFYLSDQAPDLGVVAPERDGSRTSVSVVLQVAVVDEFVARAERGGAVIQRPIEEAHGSRSAWLVDPFGHRWNVGTPVHDEAAAARRRRPSEPYYMTLSSADVERAAAFYGSVLDWQFSPPNANGGRHVVNTEMPIGIRPTEDQFATTDPGELLMWFTARDFDAAVERVRAAGGTVVELNAYDSGREAICEDDQGVTFKLSEPAPGYEK